MKAILVIDVPVNDTIDFGHMDIRANIEVKAYNDLDFKSYELQHIKVEPLPEMKYESRPMYGSSKDYILGTRIDERAVGWNACIKEILRGEEE